MMRTLPIASCTLLSALLACGAPGDFNTQPALPDDGPSGECTYETQAFIGDEDVTPIGLTATQALAIVTGERQSVLRWDHIGETTELTFEFTPAADQVTWNDGTWESAESGGGTGPHEPQCEDFLEATGTLRFVTADGRMDEAIGLTMRINEHGSGRIDHTVSYESLNGGYEPVVIDVDEAWARIDVEFAVNISQDALGGELALQAERSESGEMEAYDIARWPSP